MGAPVIEQGKVVGTQFKSADNKTSVVGGRKGTWEGERFTYDEPYEMKQYDPVKNPLKYRLQQDAVQNQSAVLAKGKPPKRTISRPPTTATSSTTGTSLSSSTSKTSNVLGKSS